MNGFTEASVDSHNINTVEDMEVDCWYVYISTQLDDIHMLTTKPTV